MVGPGEKSLFCVSLAPLVLSVLKHGCPSVLRHGCPWWSHWMVSLCSPGVILKPATITTRSGNPYMAVLISWFLVQVHDCACFLMFFIWLCSTHLTQPDNFTFNITSGSWFGYMTVHVFFFIWLRSSHLTQPDNLTFNITSGSWFRYMTVHVYIFYLALQHSFYTVWQPYL